jgi:hypothetical protein
MATLAEARWDWGAAAVAMTLLAPVVVGVKLWIVLRIIDFPTTISRCGSAVLAAVTLNAVIPGRGGDLVRAAFLADEPGTVGVLLGAVLLERVIDVGTLGLLALIASVGGGAGWVPWLAAAACAASLVAIVVLAIGHRVPIRPELAERVGRTARRMLQRPALALALVGSSLLSWINNVAIMGFCLRAVGATTGWVDIARATPIAILAGIAPISVSGIGTRDTAMLLLLRGHGADAAITAGSFGYTILTSWFLAAFGIAALGRETLRRTRDRATAPPSPTPPHAT